MRLLLAGLWTRRRMNAATLLVCVVAISATVLGPMYGRASAEHLLDTRIDERAPYTTGLSFSVPAQEGDDLPVGDPDRYQPPTVETLRGNADTLFGDPSVRRYWSSATAWARDPGGEITYGGRPFVAPTYWREGMCDLAQVEGRCPTRPGEALMQRTMARTLGLRPGDTFDVSYTDSYLLQGKETPDGREAQRQRRQRFDIVGTYTVPDPDSPAWFDLSRFTGVDDLIAPVQQGTGSEPSAPALLVAPSSMTSQSFVVGIDRPLDTSVVNLATLGDAERSAAAFTVPDLDLASVFDQVREERKLLSRVLVAALAPLVVLSLLLLFALVSTAAQVRRPHVALAKLRGQTRGQVLWFALSEPFLVVAIAALVGVTLGVTTARLIAAAWLHEGIPVSVDAATVAGLAVVVVAALAASAVAAAAVVREPLSAALAASVRPRPPSRLSLVLRSAVVAVAVAAVLQVLTSGNQSDQLLALLTPMLIALAVAVGGAALLRVVTRWWLRRTARSGGPASYLASRRLARRPDLANLMVPLLLAVAVLTFATSASATSDAWRVSRAKADVGAARTFVAAASPGRLLQVTRQVDPDGRYVAAAALNTAGDDMARGVFVDTTRLARVAAWDRSWSEESVASLAQKLVPGGERLRFTGERLTVEVGDVSLRSSTGVRSILQLQYVDDRGEQTDLPLGELTNRASQRLTVPLARCSRGCAVEQFFLTGSSASVSDVEGTLRLSSVAVDGRTVDWGLDDPSGWRPARPFPETLADAPVAVTASPAGLRMDVTLGRSEVAGFARVTPTLTPDVVPALVAASTATESASGSAVVGTSLNGQQVPMRVVDRVAALPVVGDEGSLSDLETALVEFEPPAGAVVTTELWTAPGTPASVLAAIRAAGVPLTEPTSLDATLHDLRTDAFSLGLRLFLIVGVATLLLAVLGVFTSAVLQSRWRAYEVASLRVVGVSSRALVRGSVLEYVVLLGVAVLLGLLSAYLALKLALPSMSLGTAAEHDPGPVYDVHWAIVAGVGGVLFLLAVLIAVVVSRRVTRLGTPSTLRWAEQG
jgi:putative ABC transport system permease protein